MIIAFDLDGTLIDSARDLGEAASELVQGFGAPPLSVSQVVTMVGDGAPVLVRRALERSGLDPDTPGALDRFLEIYDRRLMDHTVAYPGIREELSRAVARGPLAVLTNKPLGPSIGILEALGLRGFFTRIIGGVPGANGGVAVTTGAMRSVAAVMAELGRYASSTGGVTVAAGDEASVAAAIGIAASQTETNVSIHPMQSPWWMLPFVACLSTEWWLRRRAGLR